MYRHQLHMKVTMGKYREFYEVVGRLNDVLRSKGMVQLQMWAPSTGSEMNTVILVSDHNSLADWDAEGRKFQTDTEVMKVWREAGPFVEGHPWDELWENAYQIA